MQCGADALADDPLSKLSLSNRALWRAIRQLDRMAVPTIVLGGGGYNPWSVARCWTGIWGALAGFARPSRLPAGAEAVLRNSPGKEPQDATRPTIGSQRLQIRRKIRQCDRKWQR